MDDTCVLLKAFRKAKERFRITQIGVKTWGYDSGSTSWYVRDDITNTVAKTVVLTLQLKNHNYYVVDIYYSR